MSVVSDLGKNGIYPDSYNSIRRAEQSSDTVPLSAGLA
jgi:hypothetical protein